MLAHTWTWMVRLKYLEPSASVTWLEFNVTSTSRVMFYHLIIIFISLLQSTVRRSSPPLSQAIPLSHLPSSFSYRQQPSLGPCNEPLGVLCYDDRYVVSTVRTRLLQLPSVLRQTWPDYIKILWTMSVPLYG